MPVLEAYNKKCTPKTSDPHVSANWWGNYPKYSVSLLKSLFGEKATKENDFGYALAAQAGRRRELLLAGSLRRHVPRARSRASSPGVRTRRAQAPMPTRSGRPWPSSTGWSTSTSSTTRPAPSGRARAWIPKKIKTEVFILPAAASVEKEGSITNRGRWAQWRYKAVDPPGRRRAGRRHHERADAARSKSSTRRKEASFPEPILNLKWDYINRRQVRRHKVAKEINGYFLKDVDDQGQEVQEGRPGSQLSPSCRPTARPPRRNWLYCNSYTEKGNMMARRDKADPTGLGLYPEWAWCWPVNRRILYNRASVDLQGAAVEPQAVRVIRLEPARNGSVTCPTAAGRPCSSRRQPNDSKCPFIMKPDGVRRVFGPGRADGPFPEHYEPLECPVPKNSMSDQLINPTIKIFNGRTGQAPHL